MNCFPFRDVAIPLKWQEEKEETTLLQSQVVLVNKWTLMKYFIYSTTLNNYKTVT